MTIKLTVKAFRRHGQPALAKPKELRGIRQAFSVPYNPKCRCPVFIKDDDVWVKHRDYFSGSLVKPKDYGKPLNMLCDQYLGKNRPKKFVYEDAWGDILARQEAWLKVSGVITALRKDRFYPRMVGLILRQQERLHGLDEYKLSCTYAGGYMERFWEKVMVETLKVLLVPK